MNPRDESLFIRALQQKPIPRTPIWLMRQAGRYLPEYRRVREQAGDFLTLCKTPELACEVTLQPLKRYALDAAILFSDILTIPDAMGLGLYFAEGEGPCFRSPLKTAADIANLTKPNVEESLSYVFDAVKMIRHELPVAMPLIGFSGSPWTLACYMVEGRGRTNFPRIFDLLQAEPKAAQSLVVRLAEVVVDYLVGQVNAGVDALMLFDTWGGLLATADYPNMSLAPMKYIVLKIKEKYPHIPIILFTKGGGQWLDALAATGCDALGIDWTLSLRSARAIVKDSVCLQGNLEPAILLKSEKEIVVGVQEVLASYGHGHGHIFNLGHGITPDVPPENVSILIDAVQQISPQYHR